MNHKISIVIPTFNEEKHIGQTVSYLFNQDRSGIIHEVIVSDGGSTDSTVNEARLAGAKVIACPEKGRATQMNAGARVARSHILYFLHADSIPPQNFAVDILENCKEGYTSGCYRLRFDVNHWFLNLNCWFTRFDIDAFRYGDQSLFVTREVFMATGGFCEKHIVMEDQEMVKRIKKLGPFKIMEKAVVTSARKYLDNGMYRMQAIFVLIYCMYQLGFSQARLLATFRKLIKQDKL